MNFEGGMAEEREKRPHDIGEQPIKPAGLMVGRGETQAH